MSLAKDTRGAMIVLGVFVCLILAGALFYLVGLGDALVFRERTQEAADATAFTAGALQARGMNVLVVLNLTMAAILSIRVALKAVFTLALIAQIVFTALCAVPFMQWACPVAGVATSVVAYTRTALDVTRAPINMAIVALNRSGTAIARAVPAAAIAASKQVGDRYAPAVTLAAASAEPTAVARGLPVEDGTSSKLCGEAAGTIGRVIGAILGGSGAGGKVGDFIGDRLEGLVRGAPGYFCEIPGATLDPRRVGADDLRRAAGDTCDARRTSAGDAAAAKGKDRAEAEADFDGAKCRRDEERRMRRDMRPGPPPPPGPALQPKRVRDDAGNGCVAHQTLGVSEGSDEVVGRTPYLVNVANGFHRDASGPARSAIRIVEGVTPDAFAQAEWFYDCPGGWTAAACNSDDEAMWHLRWRARLRPVDGSIGAVRAATTALGAAFAAKLTMDRAAALTRPTSPGNSALANELGATAGNPAAVVTH